MTGKRTAPEGLVFPETPEDRLKILRRGMCHQIAPDNCTSGGHSCDHCVFYNNTPIEDFVEWYDQNKGALLRGSE